VTRQIRDSIQQISEFKYVGATSQTISDDAALTTADITLA
jgi:hypothetical protein